jgi:Reverse transcriptase (RNA-dependent DNA polymerase)
MSNSNVAIRHLRGLRNSAGRGTTAWRSIFGGATNISTPLTVNAIADVGRLLRAYHDRKQWAGTAPGLDDLTWDDVGRSEAGAIFRQVNREILAGHYRPVPARIVRIPRPGRSPRVLSIGSIFDRTVAHSLAGAMVPTLKRVVSPWAFAYRPKRSHLDMLAWLGRLAREEDRWVIGNFDVANAFPTTPIDLVLDAHRQAGIADRPLLYFIESVLRGADGADHTVGLAQGCPYAPSAFELTMQHLLQPETNEPPRLRFADNLVSLCRCVPEARRERDRYQASLSRKRMRLKEDGPDPSQCTIANLKGGNKTELLGYVLSHAGGELRLKLPDSKWEALSQDLLESLWYPNPSARAQQVIGGWVDAAGPSLRTRGMTATAVKIHDMLVDHDFREHSIEQIMRELVSSRERWIQRVMVVNSRQMPSCSLWIR